MIGINNRDLDAGGGRRRDHLRADARRAGRQDRRRRERDLGASGELEELERVGVDAVLIGEALMGAADPEAQGARADRRRRGHPRAPAPLAKFRKILRGALRIGQRPLAPSSVGMTAETTILQDPVRLRADRRNRGRRRRLAGDRRRLGRGRQEASSKAEVGGARRPGRERGDEGGTQPRSTKSTSAMAREWPSSEPSEAEQEEASTFNPFGQPEGGGTATGSGFVIDTDGHLVTNNHVVENASKITVKLGASDKPIRPRSSASTPPPTSPCSRSTSPQTSSTHWPSATPPRSKSAIR